MHRKLIVILAIVLAAGIVEMILLLAQARRFLPVELIETPIPLAAADTPTLSPPPTSTPKRIASSTATFTPAPTMTAAASNTGTPTHLPPLPTPAELNGVPLDSVIVLPPEVQEHIRQIFAAGQARGRNARAFSKLGDSTIEDPYFMGRFDGGPYNLGPYGYLQPTIDYYAGSFGRDSIAVQIGLHTWSVFDPMFADPDLCRANEHMLACEFRLHNPSVLFIRLGSNDVGLPDLTETSLRRIIDYCLEQGVIPILGTKADRFEGRDNFNNNLLRQLAAEYRVPLWDFDLIAQTLPGRGLAGDGVHLTGLSTTDYTQPQALQRGYGVHNLTALMMLDRVWRAVVVAP